MSVTRVGPIPYVLVWNYDEVRAYCSCGWVSEPYPDADLLQARLAHFCRG